MFGSASPPQSESTPFHARSPHRVSKVFAYWATANSRGAYAMFAVNGILFNHGSVRRRETFVTRKIMRAVARIKADMQDKLYLGTLGARRDWVTHPSTSRRCGWCSGRTSRRTVDHLRGDPTRARERLGWRARTGFRSLVELMAGADIRLLEDERAGRLVRVDRNR